MPISLLSGSTVRAIGSSVVLNDTCSVVKEFIDNSLDAKATSIFVEISPNTLDVIQVKDNGIGIGPADRQNVCKLNYTNKLETLEDLKTIGSRSLGFRGQALGSVAELSGKVTVITRVDGDLVAAKLVYNRAGELVSSENASHAVGTTVRVEDFLQYLPVRKQTVIKSSYKTLAGIKKIIQAYAFARPSIRWSLKVLKGKNVRHNWIYGPKPNASVMDVAVVTCGQDIATKCTLEKTTSNGREGDESEQALDPTVLSSPSSVGVLALLPAADCDPSGIPNGGQILAIDGRPMATTRGFGKELVRMYKSYIRSISSWHNAERCPNDPFLFIHLVCKPGSYDINIEPAKDDVMFVDTPAIMAIVETFFKSLYGELQNSKPTPKPALNRDRSGIDQMGSDFQVLLARKSEDTTQEGSSNEAHDSSKPHPSLDSHSNEVREQMQNARQPPDDLPAANQETFSDSDEDSILSVDESEIADPKVTNPWTMAKLHATIRPRMQSALDNKTVSQGHLSPFKGFASSSPMMPKLPERSHKIHAARTLPSPDKSPSPRFSLNPSRSLRHSWNGSALGDDHRDLQTPVEEPSSVLSGPKTNILDTWISYPSQPARNCVVQEGKFATPATPKNTTGKRYKDFNPPASASQLEEVEGIETASLLLHRDPLTKGRKLFDTPPLVHSRTSINHAFTPHFRKSSQQSQNESPGNVSSETALPSKVSSLVSSSMNSEDAASTNDLDAVMEFEYRKKAAQTAQRQVRLANFQQPTVSLANLIARTQKDHNPFQSLSQWPSKSKTNSPHNNRYLSAKMRLSQPDTSLTSVSSTFSTPLSPASRVESPRPPANLPLAGSGDHPITLLKSTITAPATKLAPSDPRRRLMTNLHTKLKRTKSSLLPLETGPPGSQLHNISCTVHIPTSMSSGPQTSRTPPWENMLVRHAKKRDIYTLTSSNPSANEYISDDWSEGDVVASTKEIEQWEHRLKQLLLQHLQSEHHRTHSNFENQTAESGHLEEDFATYAETITKTVESIEIHLHRRLRAFVDALSKNDETPGA